MRGGRWECSGEAAAVAPAVPAWPSPRGSVRATAGAAAAVGGRRRRRLARHVTGRELRRQLDRRRRAFRRRSWQAERRRREILLDLLDPLRPRHAFRLEILHRLATQHAGGTEIAGRRRLLREVERLKHDRNAIRPRGVQARREVGGTARLVRQRAQQLEQVGHRRVARHRHLVYAVQQHPLDQRLELGGGHRLAVDLEVLIVDAHLDIRILHHPDQRAELALLILLLGRIAKQVDGARQMGGEDDGIDHER